MSTKKTEDIKETPVTEEKEATLKAEEIVKEESEVAAAPSEEPPEILMQAPTLKASGQEVREVGNMIHKHLDNFLAKIAGETPEDETIRNSTEYWLNKIAESGGGEEKHLYLHNITMASMGGDTGYTVTFTIIDDRPNKYGGVANIAKFIKKANNTTKTNPYFATGLYFSDYGGVRTGYQINGLYTNDSATVIHLATLSILSVNISDKTINNVGIDNSHPVYSISPNFYYENVTQLL